MLSRTLKFQIDGNAHKLEVRWGWFSGKRIISLNGKVLERVSSNFLDYGSRHEFSIDGRNAVLLVLPGLRRPKIAIQVGDQRFGDSVQGRASEGLTTNLPTSEDIKNRRFGNLVLWLVLFLPLLALVAVRAFKEHFSY